MTNASGDRLAASFRIALALLLAAVSAYFWPVWLEGKVFYQQDNAVILGARQAGPEETVIKNDQVIQYIPAMQRHLNGDHAAWLAAWDPTTQLGRPLMQLSGVGKAFLLTHALSFVTSDPYVLYTLLMVSIAFLTAVFIFYLFRAEGADAWISAAAGLSLPLGWWMAPHLRNLPMAFNVCWTAGLLTSTAAFIRRPSFTAGTAVSFMVYSLLLTSYPQLTVLTAYLCAAYAAVSLKKNNLDGAGRVRTACLYLVCVLAGTAAALPYFMDLYVRASRSVRLEMPDTYFFYQVGSMDTIRRLVKFFTDFTPLFLGLFALSFTRGYFRRFWIWKGIVVVCLVLSMIPPARLVAVRYLGFGLSSGFHFLLYGMLIPVFAVGARMLRELLERKIRTARVHAVMWGCVFPLLSLKWGLLPGLFTRSRDLVSSSGNLWMLGLWGAVYVFFLRPARWLLAAIVIAGVFGWMEVKAIEPGSILRSSSLVEQIRDRTRDGLRYGFIGEEEPNVLPPNTESLAGIRSLHSYDSLSSEAYQQWTRRISDTGASAEGRFFRRISNDGRVGDPAYTYAGLGLLLSARDLTNPKLRPAGRNGPIRFYEPVHPALLEVQLTRFKRTQRGEVEIEGPLDGAAGKTVRRTQNRDDFLSFEIEASEDPTVLFLSQQYHPHWRASWNGKRFETVVINGFYQGVLLPPGTARVELAFKPYVLWIWVPQALFVMAGMVSLVFMVKRPRPVIK